MPAVAPLLFLFACPTEPRPDAPAPTDPACSLPSPVTGTSSWGGLIDAEPPAATGFFGLTQRCGRDWLRDPDGYPFRSFGINTFGPYGAAGQVSGRDLYGEYVASTYGSSDAWAEAQLRFVRSFGLNTGGAWSDTTLLVAHGFPVTPILYLSGGDWLTGEIVDWWDPAWQGAVETAVAEKVAPWVDEPAILGWFLDNEMRWGPDWRGPETLLALYLRFSPEAAGKTAAVDSLLDHFGDISALNQELGTGFAGRDDMLAATDWPAFGVDDPWVRGFLSLAADRYFSVTATAVREVDPNHLLLGNREVSVMTPAEVYEAAGQWLDVVSINDYVFTEGIAEVALTLSGGLDPADGFAAQHALAGRPMLITEFGFRADDSGLPNSWPPQYPTYETQAERGVAYTSYVETYRAVPWVLGWHWFQWVDQPEEGRFDGEDNNWGLVNISGEPYTEVLGRMATQHFVAQAELLAP